MTSFSEKLSVLYFLGFILLFFSCGQKDPPLEMTSEGAIAVMTDPIGARIFLDGLDTGRTTPDTLFHIPVGTYTVSVVLSGYESSPGSHAVEVLENNIIPIEFLLFVTAKEGAIAVVSSPMGAAIFLDGTSTGRTTPDTLSNVLVGIYSVHIELQGHKSCPESLSVQVLENETVQAIFSLLNAQHVVLGEDFTSTTCEPCFPSSLVLDSLSERYSGSFIVIRYHVWWPPPGDDPFYLDNTVENAARNDYYDNLFAPHLFLDGSIDAGRDHNVWETILEERMKRETEIDITISNTTNGLQGNATASIVSCADLSGRALRAHFVITESGIEFEAPNGKSIFHQVMRDMLPDPTGEPITLLPETNVQLTRDYTIDFSWNPDHLHIVVFVQDNDTREILQAASDPIR